MSFACVLRRNPVLVSISSTFYVQIFCMNVVLAAFFLVTCTFRVRRLYKKHSPIKLMKLTAVFSFVIFCILLFFRQHLRLQNKNVIYILRLVKEADCFCRQNVDIKKSFIKSKRHLEKSTLILLYRLICNDLIFYYFLRSEKITFDKNTENSVTS